MQKKTVLILILLLLSVVACGPADEPATVEATAVAPETDDGADDSGISPRPTITPRAEGDPDDDAYPALPEPTPLPEGYPLAGEPVPTLNPYPGIEATAVIVHPIGEQCGDPATFRYADMQAATADLVAAGVNVLSATTVGLIVADVCGGPTSAHYQITIDANDLAKAEAIEWSLMP